MFKIYITLSLTFGAAIANAQYLDSFDLNKSTIQKNSYARATVYDTTLYIWGTNTAGQLQLWEMGDHDIAPKPTITFGHKYIGASAIINGAILFSAGNGPDSLELWFRNNDGKTGMIKDLYPGNRGSTPRNFMTGNNKLYFSASTPEHGNELWCYEHSSGILERLTDINPGSDSSNPQELIMFHNKIYFQAYTAAYGKELYEYNPSSKVVRLVADIIKGPVGSIAKKPIVFNNKLYFVAFTYAYGVELYSYDGTFQPVRVTDLAPGPADGVCVDCEMATLNDKLYFTGNGDLYRYDPVSDKIALADKMGFSSSCNVVCYNNALYFDGYEFNTTDHELWKFDGTRATRITNFSKNTGVWNLAATSHAIFFSARSEVIGTELFRYSEYPLSVGNTTSKTTISLYPNPTQDIAHLQLKLSNAHALSISVTDINGRTVFTKPNTLYSAAKHTIDIPMHNLPQGNYVYRIDDADGKLMASGKMQKL